MVDLRLGITFQTERLALIREIARNIVGETRPGGTGTVGGGTVGTGTTGTISTGGIGSVNEPDVAGTDDALLADRVVPREEQVATAAARLAGLRLPQPMFLEPQAYRQVLAELAKSDPVLAAMAGGNSAPDVNPADPDAPVMPGMGMGMGAEAFRPKQRRMPPARRSTQRRPTPVRTPRLRSHRAPPCGARRRPKRLTRPQPQRRRQQPSLHEPPMHRP